MTTDKLVSIIIPTYSRPTTIVRTLKSALAQTYESIEVIVVDDNGEGSANQNATQAQLGDFIKNNKIKYLINKQNSGACASRNNGCRKSMGEYLCFLDDDDVMESTIIEKLVHKYNASIYRNLGIVYSWIDVIGLENEQLSVHCSNNTGFIYNEIHYKYDLPGNSGSWLIRRNIFELVGGFDEALPSFQDYDLALRITKNHPVDYVPEILLHIYEDHSDRISTNYESKIVGDRAFFNKHLPGSKGIMRNKFKSDHYRRMGSYYFELKGHRFLSIKNYFCSIIYYPLNRSSWKNILPLLILPRSIFLRLKFHT